MIKRKFKPYLEKAGFDFNRQLVIFDVGARDCKESIECLEVFPNATVFAFECNPQTLPLCRDAATKFPERLTLVEKAVNERSGTCTFHPIDPTKTRTTWPDGNPGASSLFMNNGTYWVEQYVQNTINVSCTTLSDICREYSIQTVNLLWMDLQGAELIALKSMGEFLKGVEFMCIEVSYKPIYTGQVLYPEINAFLEKEGFVCISPLDPNGGKWQEDAVYQRLHST